MSKDRYDTLISDVDNTLILDNDNSKLCYQFIYKVESFKYYLMRYRTYDTENEPTLLQILKTLNREVGGKLKSADLLAIKTLRNSLAHDPGAVLEYIKDPEHVKYQMQVVDSLHTACSTYFKKEEEKKVAKEKAETLSATTTIIRSSLFTPKKD